MIGETLGHYRIEARLGAGGMGVVYRAHDERLHRLVAIKLVDARPGTHAVDEASLLREARAASALNHPHICTVYEVGEANGRPFIAMEFVDGQPLSQLIPPGGLPTEAVIRYGVQIADALVHAHEHGVIHRDLKTANVVVATDGRAKVLDFGLARRADPADADTATRSKSNVEAGELAGTLAYMAPEVLLGRQDDERSDVWALGVVLHELATGELPFTGRSKYDLTAAILREPPPPLPPAVPPMLRAIIQRCLVKEPERRYQRASEVRAALEAMQSDTAIVPAAPSWPRVPLVATAIAAAGLALLAGWFLLRDRPTRWERLATDGHLRSVVSTSTRTFMPAISPDGGMLAWVAQGTDGTLDLHAGRVAGGARLQLTNDPAVEVTPRFSPDGERIAFTRRAADAAVSDIRIVPTLGGDAVTAVHGAAFPAWSPDGARLAYISQPEDGSPGDLTVAGVDGSAPRTLLGADSTYPFLREPAWSPDGQEVAVVRGRGGASAEIWRVPLDGGAAIVAHADPATVFSEGPVYTPDGTGIVHSSNRGGATNIWFLPLDGGAPVRLTSGPGPDEAPTVARTGAIAFVNSQWRSVIERYDLETDAVATLATHKYFFWEPAVSPDGKDVAFSRSESDGSWHLWSVPLTGGEPKRLSDGAAGEVYSRYMPDGRSLLFYTWNSPHRIGRVASVGGPLTFLPIGGNVLLADPSPDGRRIVFTRSEQDGDQIYIADLDGSSDRLVTTTPGTTPRWSPDGRAVAFARNRSYRSGIVVVNADGRNERQVSPTGGWPVWWPDGRQIGYLVVGPDGNQLIEVRDLQSGAVRRLESVRLIGTNHPFTVAPDGRTLIVSNSQHLADEIWLLEPGA